MKKQITPLQKALNVYAIILLVWGFYRYIFKANMPIWFDEFIAKPTVFIIPLYYYIRNIEKKNFLAGLDFHFKTIKRDILLGISIGVIFFLSTLVANMKITGDIFSRMSSSAVQTSFIFFVIIAIATSISEEILARGFVLKRMYEDSKNVFMSAFGASILFFFIHIPFLLTSQQLMGNALLQVAASDIIFSLAVSFIFLQTRSLLLAILIHAFYSISIYFIHFAFS